jgi:hypothetical protein
MVQRHQPGWKNFLEKDKTGCAFHEAGSGCLGARPAASA